MSLHPRVIEKNGGKKFVVLPYDEFLAIEEQLADYQDLQSLRQAKADARNDPSVPLNDVIAELGSAQGD